MDYLAYEDIMDISDVIHGLFEYDKKTLETLFAL